ncbi:MAG: chalcone isomerase family protein [Desulfuromonadales bacterium]
MNQATHNRPSSEKKTGNNMKTLTTLTAAAVFAAATQASAEFTLGDRYRLIYRPGTGTELRLNDRRLGTIPGDDFAVAYFSLWLGEQPIDKRFRDRLLGID